MGICNRISFPYPQTFLSVGISNETSFSYPQTFHSVGISNETSFSYPQTFHSVGISNETSFSYPQTIHVEAEEWVQRSLILSPVPTLRRKKGTEKFVPVPCAHAAAEEGYREACPCHLCPRCGGRMGTGGICPVYGAPTLRAMHPIHKCVAKGAPHLFH